MDISVTLYTATLIIAAVYGFIMGSISKTNDIQNNPPLAKKLLAKAEENERFRKIKEEHKATLKACNR